MTLAVEGCKNLKINLYIDSCYSDNFHLFCYYQQNEYYYWIKEYSYISLYSIWSL